MPRVRDEIVLDADDADPVELESFRRVKRHQRHAVDRRVPAVDVRDQRDPLEEHREVIDRIATDRGGGEHLLDLGGRGDELVEVLLAVFGGRGVGLLEMLLVFADLDDALDERVQREFVPALRDRQQVFAERRERLARTIRRPRGTRRHGSLHRASVHARPRRPRTSRGPPCRCRAAARRPPPNATSSRAGSSRRADARGRP